MPLASFRFALASLAVLAVSSPAALMAQEKVIRVGIEATDISTLDPHRTSATPEKVPIDWIFGGLVRFPPGSADPAKIEPDLAESWEKSANGLVWTFKLRRGVQFHKNYGEATAEDVVYSLKRAADAKRSSFAGDFREVASVEALDPYTVRLTLSAPVPNLLGLVSNYHGGQIVSKKADEELGDRFKLNPVGFGPFELVRHETQAVVTLQAHAGYYRGKPQIDRILYRFLPSDVSRELAFQANEIDIIQGKREQRWVTTMKAKPNTVVDVTVPGEFRTVFINKRIKPLDDIRVREAIVRAIDVRQLQRFVGADVTKLTGSVVPPGYLGAVEPEKPLTTDVNRAKALLAEAGHPNGITIKAVVSSINSQQPIMEVIQSQLKRAGINLEMDIVDHTTYHAQIRKDISALVFYGAARFPIADTYLTQFYHSRAEIGAPGQVTNFGHCNVADAEIDAARVETDQAKQLALWKAAQDKINAEICAIPLFDLLQVWVRKPNVDFGVPFEGAMNLGVPLNERSRLR